MEPGLTAARWFKADPGLSLSASFEVAEHIERLGHAARDLDRRGRHFLLRWRPIAAPCQDVSTAPSHIDIDLVELPIARMCGRIAEKIVGTGVLGNLIHAV